MLLSWVSGVFNLSAISLVITSATLLIVNYYLKARQIPHGPTGLPIFGYWPFLSEKTGYLQLDALKKKYGDLFTFTMAGHLFVNLGSYKVLREAQVAQSDNFGRFQNFSVLNCVFRAGIGFVNGEEWKAFRKFFMQSIKRRGLLAVKDSGSMYESINSTIEDLRTMGEEPVNIIQLMMQKCTNVFRQTMFGDTVSEERMREINECFATVTKFMTTKNLLLNGNVARYGILPFKSGYHDFKARVAKVEGILYEIINEHKSTYDEENIRNVIDEYFKERDDRRRKGDPSAQYFTDEALMSSLVEIVGDGVITVSVNIILTLISLLNHPEEQEKIFSEIAEVVGLDRQPIIEDKSQLPYTNAFILEVLRTSQYFPFFPSQECKKDTTIRGVVIPKGAITVLNKWSAHHDPEEFEEPTKFNPSRFITAEGKKRPELPLAFGIGKRACAGEGFAMIQVFLFMATIIKNFRLTPAHSSQENFFELFLNGQLRIHAQPRSHSGNVKS